MFIYSWLKAAHLYTYLGRTDTLLCLLIPTLS